MSRHINDLNYRVFCINTLNYNFQSAGTLRTWWGSLCYVLMPLISFIHAECRTSLDNTLH